MNENEQNEPNLNGNDRNEEENIFLMNSVKKKKCFLTKISKNAKKNEKSYFFKFLKKCVFFIFLSVFSKCGFWRPCGGQLKYYIIWWVIRQIIRSTLIFAQNPRSQHVLSGN